MAKESKVPGPGGAGLWVAAGGKEEDREAADVRQTPAPPRWC